MAFELRHGSIISAGLIEASVSKEENEAFSARANDVFSNLKMTVQTDAGSNLPLSSSDEDEDLLPLCEAQVAKRTNQYACAPRKICKRKEHNLTSVIPEATSKSDSEDAAMKVETSPSKISLGKCKRSERKVTFAMPEATFQSDDEDATMKIDASPGQNSFEKCRRSERNVTFAIPQATLQLDNRKARMKVDARPSKKSLKKCKRSSKSDNEDVKMKVDAGPRQTGVVTRWDNGRGFGFIEPSDGGKGVFCHVTVIQDGNSLEEGSTVSYSAVYDDRRRKYRAENVTGGVTIDRVRPSEVARALKDETRFTHYSLEDIDVSNSSNTKVGHSLGYRVVRRRFGHSVVRKFGASVLPTPSLALDSAPLLQLQAAVSFLNSKKSPVEERHVCKVGSVKFKPRHKETTTPPSDPTTASDKTLRKVPAPHLSHLDTIDSCGPDQSLAAPIEDTESAIQSPPTQFKKKKKKKNKARRNTRTLQVF